MTLYFIISTDQKTQISHSKIKNKTMKKKFLNHCHLIWKDKGEMEEEESVTSAYQSI